MFQPHIGMVISCDRYALPICSTVVEQQNQCMSHRCSPQPTNAAFVLDLCIVLVMKVAVAHIVCTGCSCNINNTCDINYSLNYKPDSAGSQQYFTKHSHRIASCSAYPYVICMLCSFCPGTNLSACNLQQS